MGDGAPILKIEVAAVHAYHDKLGTRAQGRVCLYFSAELLRAEQVVRGFIHCSWNARFLPGLHDTCTGLSCNSINYRVSCRYPDTEAVVWNF